MIHATDDRRTANAVNGEVRPWVGYLMNQVAGEIRLRTSAAVQPFGLTPPMLRSLDVIAADQPLTQAQLGARVHMDRTTVVQMVDRFEALGYARRDVDPSDRRSHALALTPKGKAVLQRARQAARDVEQNLLAPLSIKERQQLIALLQKLHRPTPSPQESK